MSPRTVHLLGRPFVEDATAQAGHIRGNKPWAIVAYLALHNRAVERGHLVDVLFGDADDPYAALRWNLTQARRIVGDPDALRDSTLHVARDRVRFDVDVVISARWDEAVALPGVGADLLAGMQFAGCAGFESWLLGERRHLAAAAAAVLHEAAIARLARGEFTEAIGLVTRLLTIDPLNDAHHELLIRSYRLAGDPQRAQRQLDATIRQFRAELGCDPSPGVFLAAQIPSGASTPKPSAATARAMLDAGEARALTGDTPAALRLLNEACHAAAQTADVHLQARAQITLGRTLIGFGVANHQAGELAIHHAIDAAARSGDSTLAAAAYRILGASDTLRGDYGRARARLDQAEQNGTGDNDEIVEIATLRGVGALDQGDHAAALDLFARALAADPERNHGFTPMLLTHTGRAHLLTHDLTNATGRLTESLALAETRAWVAITPAPLALLGHVAVRQGDLDRARKLLDDALARATVVDDPCWETWAAHGLAVLADAHGLDDTAVWHFADSIDRSRPERGGHLWSRAWALTDAVPVATRRGDTRAAAWEHETRDIIERCGMRQLSDTLTKFSAPDPDAPAPMSNLAPHTLCTDAGEDEGGLGVTVMDTRRRRTW